MTMTHKTPSNSDHCTHDKAWTVDCSECGRAAFREGLDLSNNAVRIRLEMLEHAAFSETTKAMRGMLEHNDKLAEALSKPIPMRLPCPKCGALHVDEGEFATKAHHAHACQACGEVWRPAVVYTVGVRFLPGFRNAEVAPPSPAVERETDSAWFYAEASDAEDWHGPHDSEADAVAEARADYAGAREDFWVDEALPVDWQKVFASFADVDRVLEDLGDYIGDNEHVPDPEPEFATSKAEAQAALEAWFAAHVKMRPYYQCVGKPKGYLVSDPQPASPDARPLEPAPCVDCRGTGYVSNRRDSLPCSRCGGTGAEPPPGMAGPAPTNSTRTSTPASNAASTRCSSAKWARCC